MKTLTFIVKNEKSVKKCETGGPPGGSPEGAIKIKTKIRIKINVKKSEIKATDQKKNVKYPKGGIP